MSHLAEIPPAVLATYLESIHENEGVLVCRDHLPAMDDGAIERCFSTFLFSSFMGVDSGLNFTHGESGTSVCYMGSAVSLAFGGTLTEAISDLLQTLYQLGWRNIDIYSDRDVELYEDLARHMPASSDIQLRRCDIPTELNEDLREFSARVAAGGNTDTNGRSTIDEFNDVFRADSRLAPSPHRISDEMPLPIANNYTEVPEGMGVGVSRNYVPDDDPSLSAPSVPAPMPMPAAKRIVVQLKTASPVDGGGLSSSDDRPLIEHAMVPAPSPAPVAADLDVKSIPTEAAVKQALPSRQLAAQNSPPAETLNFPVSEICMDKPIAIGDAIVVFDLPGNRLSKNTLTTLCSMEVGNRKAIWIEPGAQRITEHHRDWALFGEIQDGRNSIELARGLIASLWQQSSIHPVALSMFWLLRSEQSERVTLNDLLDLAMDEPATLISRMSTAAETNEVLKRLLPLVMYAYRSQTLELVMGRIASDIWPVVLSGDAACNERDESAISFLKVASGGDTRLIVVALDALDKGGAAEFVVNGLLRWLTLLAGSQRVAGVEKTPVSEAELLAKERLAGLSPEVLVVLERILSLKSKNVEQATTSSKFKVIPDTRDL